MKKKLKEFKELINFLNKYDIIRDLLYLVALIFVSVMIAYWVFDRRKPVTNEAVTDNTTTECCGCCRDGCVYQEEELFYRN